MYLIQIKVMKYCSKCNIEHNKKLKKCPKCNFKLTQVSY